MVSLRLLATALIGFVPFAVAAIADKRDGIACDAWVNDDNIAVDNCPDGMYCFEPAAEGSDGICVEE